MKQSLAKQAFVGAFHVMAVGCLYMAATSVYAMTRAGQWAERLYGSARPDVMEVRVSHWLRSSRRDHQLAHLERR